MVRGVLGVVAGWIVWFVAFLALAILLASLWPEYRVHGRAWMNERVYDFPARMSACNVTFWILAEIAGGYVAMLVSRRREALWVLAAIVGGYLAYEHLYAEWFNLPRWYNLTVSIFAIPAVLFGGRLAARSIRRNSAAPAT